MYTKVFDKPDMFDLGGLGEKCFFVKDSRQAETLTRGPSYHEGPLLTKRAPPGRPPMPSVGLPRALPEAPGAQPEPIPKTDEPKIIC